jgi:hypothetical protein
LFELFFLFVSSVVNDDCFVIFLSSSVNIEIEDDVDKVEFNEIVTLSGIIDMRIGDDAC